MKRHRATVRGGRKRAYKTDAAYRLHLRAKTEEAGSDGASRSAWYGSKCYKTAAERRPARGGRVRPQEWRPT